jgi:drug/metabolite transporter (DMT)-like permease
MNGAYLGLTLTVILWGASFVATKIALQEIAPAVIAFLRFAMGVAVLFLILIKRNELRRFTLRELPSLSVLGILGITVHQLLQANGLQTASATATSWIVATIPVFVALLGWAFLGETMSGSRVLGILLSACGVLTVVGNGDFKSLIQGGFGTAGDRLIAISAVNWAVFVVLNKHVFKKSEASDSRSAVGQMFAIMSIGWILLIPWAIADGGLGELERVSLQGWLALAFLGVGCSGVAYYLWFSGLECIDATQVGVFLYLEPIVTVLLAWQILGEMIGAATIIGGAAILVGVWLVNRSPALRPSYASPGE